MSPEIWTLGGGLVAGAGIGLFFFGGLWLTVARIPASTRPHLLLLSSFFLRLLGALAAFYALVPLGWQGMGAALAGLLVARRLFVKSKGAPVDALT